MTAFAAICVVLHKEGREESLAAGVSH